jgi:hypothetical protein
MGHLLLTVSGSTSKQCEGATTVLEMKEQFDKSLGQVRRTYSLDKIRLCFLSVFIWPDGEIDKYSFDVEKAGDSHYVIPPLEMRKLIAAYGGEQSETDAAAVFHMLLEHGDARSYTVIDFMDRYGVKYQLFHYG